MIRRTAFQALPLAAALMLAGLSACKPASAASDVVKLPAPTVDAVKTTQGDETAVLAGGCFWGIEAVFEHVKGVHKVLAGYAGGNAGTASYEQVSDGDTGHAESVRIQFDPNQVSYGTLLQVFFSVALDPIRQCAAEQTRSAPGNGERKRVVRCIGEAALLHVTAERHKKIPLCAG